MTEKVDATVAALLGAGMALVFLATIWPSWSALTSPPGEPFSYTVFSRLLTDWLDYRTLIIILSIMIITEPVKDSGLFQFIAVYALRLTHGHPMLLLAVLCLITFAISTVLTFMAAMLLVGSLTVIICHALELESGPFLISEAMVTNTGAISTMVSGPPNMLIATATGYDFLWFLVHLTPLAVVMTIASILVCSLLYRKQLKQLDPEKRGRLMELNPWNMVPERGLFYRTAVLLLLMVAGFVLFPQFTFIIAFLAAIAFIIGGHPDRVIRAVEWSSILFFAGLFIVVGVMKVFGVETVLAEVTGAVLGGNPFTASLGILAATWVATNFTDDTALMLTMIPVIQSLVSTGMAAVPLWLSLTLGVQLSAFTPVANTGNMLAYRLARQEARPIPYAQFVVVGVAVSLVFLGISALYIILRLMLFPGF
jgi:Na+/H+ antiporter NhaD/arsenite permease-like protein